MQKSFKKAIACLLAVLMVAFAMPFSAFAAVGDYEPDVQLQFSSFFDADEQTDPTEKAASSTTCFESSSLAAFPIQYDAATGTLKATKEDINTYNEYWESDTVDEDWVIGEDDIFAVTIRFDNVDIAASGNVNIRYSDNLTPAGLCSYKSGKKTYYTFASEDNHPAGFQAELEGFRKPIKKFSASGLYEGMNDTLIGDLSCIQEDPAAVADDGWSDDMMTATLVCAGDHIDVSSIDAANGFFNIEDGTYDSDNGYTYDGKFIVATFVFQYSGEGAIQFALQDPDGSIDSELNGASFFAKKSEGLAKENATTYAPNGENPGSMKMTFMGKNENKGGEEPQTTTYTVTFLDKDGEQISSTSYEENADVTIPELPANRYDDNNHYTYAWNAEPSAKATADATYQVIETSAAHSFVGVEDPKATCTTDGTITYTCACGKSYTQTSEATGHTLGDWTVVEQAVAATCEAAGKTAVEKRFCANCDYFETRGGEVVPAAGHTLGDWTVVEQAVAATCEAAGKTAVEKRECANCDYFETRGGEVVPATGHSLGDWTVATPAVAPTKDKDGATAIEKRECANCDYFETRGGEVIPALGVTVTLNKSDIGTVDGLEVGANKLAYGTDITLTATPVEGAKFVGWEISGNIVSNEATFTTKAAYDFTITPVFEDAAAATITVTFYDKYGNTIKQYKDMDVADYQAAVAAEFDSITAPTYPSYTFKEWDKSKDEILALDASTTIWAIYDKVEETQVPKYTVFTNADVILPAGIVNGEIPYDTKVTVRDTAAKAWKVGETTVAYGSEYTFYVGSDVTIDPVYETVVEKATTTVIGANLVAGSDYKFNIVATRNVPDGFTLVDYGFVYGKNLTDAELDLDKVGTQGANANAGAVKDVHAGTRNTESNEFAFNYGIKAKNAPVTAKSFVIVINKDGDTEIIYSDMFTQNY